MGRGDFPSMNNHNDGDIGESNSNNHGYGFYRRPFFWRRFYYYIPLDNTYVIMQMIVTFIILIFGVVTFITSYKFIQKWRNVNKKISYFCYYIYNDNANIFCNKIKF